MASLVTGVSSSSPMLDNSTGSLQQYTMTSLLARHNVLEDIIRSRINDMKIDEKATTELNQQITALQQQNADPATSQDTIEANNITIQALQSQQQSLISVSSRKMVELNQLVAQYNVNDTYLSNLMKAMKDVLESIANNMK